MKDISAEEGIVASGYNKQFQEFGRIFQFAKCLIFHPSSGLYSCPLAMTDGAAKTLQVGCSQQHTSCIYSFLYLNIGTKADKV